MTNNLFIKINNISLDNLAKLIPEIINKNDTIKVSYNYRNSIIGILEINISDCIYDIDTLQIVKKFTNNFSYKTIEIED